MARSQAATVVWSSPASSLSPRLPAITIQEKKIMKTSRTVRIASAIALSLLMLALLTTVASAQSAKGQGQHHQSRWKHHDHDDYGWLESRCRAERQHRRATGTGRLQGPQEGNVHGRPDSRPCLRGQGSYNAQNQLVANSVRFNGEDLEQAQATQAAVHETQVAGGRQPG